MVGADDLDRAARFYDAILVPLGLVQVERAETYAAYAPEAAKDAIELYVTTPFDQRPATPAKQQQQSQYRRENNQWQI